MMKPLMITALVVLAGIMALGLFTKRGETSATYTYADLANDLAERCVRTRETASGAARSA